MKIKQLKSGGTWTLSFDFENCTFTDGHGPFYLSGSFCNWEILEMNRIPTPMHRGANILLSRNLDLPFDTKKIEFKIFEDGHHQWVEPNLFPAIYKGWASFALNGFGTQNLVIFQE